MSEREEIKLCDWLVREADQFKWMLGNETLGSDHLKQLVESYGMLLRALAQHPSIVYMPAEASPVATGD